MKAIKILVIALVAAFTFNTVNAQTTVPAKAQKVQVKKAHKKHHHKAKAKKVTAPKM